MKGLIIKDFLSFKTYKKNLILSILIYGIVIYTNAQAKDMIMLSETMIMFLLSVYATSSFSYDEKNNTDRYVLTLPVSRKEVVLARYLVSAGSIIIGAFIGIVLFAILYYVRSGILVDLYTIYTNTSLALLLISIFQIVQIPYIYKHGYEKGRLQMYIGIVVISLVMGFIITFIPETDLGFLDKYEAVIPVIAVILSITGYYVSYRISCHIYESKEY